jgi:hypothetical protein
MIFERGEDEILVDFSLGLSERFNTLISYS